MNALQKLDDDELLRMLKLDSYEAFTEIYYRYAAALIHFTSDRIKNQEETQDVIQDIFSSLWQGRNHSAISTSLKAYLYAAARNRVTDVFRKRLIRGYYDHAVLPLSKTQAGSADLQYDAKETYGQIVHYLNDLPPRTREIFNLSRFEHHSITEIADKLDISEQTVKNQLTIALNFLRNKLLILVQLFF